MPFKNKAYDIEEDMLVRTHIFVLYRLKKNE